MAESSKRCAVVTGANKGIGFEICRQLALSGVEVVLTARDEKKGLEALDKLLQGGPSCLSSSVVFHRLDVTEPASVASLEEFIKNKFGKLDILVNNAGVGGAIIDAEALAKSDYGKEGAQVNWQEIMTQPYTAAVECIETNYYGPKRMVEAFIELLQYSDSPRIVNVSSSMGKLKTVCHEWATAVLGDAENLTEEKIDEVLHVFLRDFKEGSWASKGWPAFLPAYTNSKAALNAYTRVLAKKYPKLCINCVCPGFVKTDINFNRGILPVEEGGESPVRLALLPDGGPSGRFFIRNEESEF
ncbi:hypothetical protein SAY87_010935 [Trapa incisa]|uniref:Short-chain dehydrogenase/reductase n=1 Tax=Trapa incisa TaxID=236973 RepID=A0AAN7JIS6_9MYRT|nr:hypothetical protein SAY87_010935 [Trapa incisa]